MSTKLKPKKGTTWTSKLEKPMEPVLKEGPDKWNDKFGGSKMLIPTPKLIDRKVRKIEKGDVLLMDALRAQLAEEFNADYTCPLTSGIFFRIVAEAAEESNKEGGKNISPWWRVIQKNGELNPKLPGEGAYQAKLLSEEGFKIEKRGKSKWIVLL